MTNNTALVVVDVQRGVMESSIRREEVIANVAQLVDRARAADVPVVWVQHSDAGLVRDSDEWQLSDPLSPAADEPIVHKRFGDSFAETDLADRLQELGIERLVLCGAQSEQCIRSTFYGSIYRGYGVTLVSDAHTTEDLRPWGATFSPEQSIDMINLQAQHTVLPGVDIAVASTADVFA